MKKMLVVAAAFVASVICANAYDLKNPALLPVELKSPPKHEAVKLVEKGELKFAIIYDKADGANRQSAGAAVALIQEAFENCTGKKPEAFGLNELDMVKKISLSGYRRSQ